MCSKTFAIEKNTLLIQLDTLRKKIEQTSFEDACAVAKNYQCEEDPLGVALHELFYQQITLITYGNSLN